MLAAWLPPAAWPVNPKMDRMAVSHALLAVLAVDPPLDNPVEGAYDPDY